MQAPIPVWLRVGNVILLLNEEDVVLTKQAGGQKIDILLKGTDYPDTRDICEVLLYVLRRKRDILSVHFLYNAVHAFQPRLDGLDRIAVVLQGKLLVEYPELRLNLHQRAFIIRHQRIKRICLAF